MPEPLDIGIPEKFGDCHIGLYQPMLNRFLLTLCDIDRARDIALIASGRYPLFLVNLTTASNYCENLIDNLCCENWALPIQQIIPTEMSNYANFIVDSTHLVPVPGWQHCDPDLPEEKHYLHVCWYYLKLLDSIAANNIVRGQRIKEFMFDIFDIQQNQSDMIVQNLKKQIVAELYLCKDLNATKDSIENIIAKAKKDHDLVF
jgi:hypothetical protein